MERAEPSLRAQADFIARHSWLYSGQVVNFLVHNLWERVPEEWRAPLLSLSSAELISLPSSLPASASATFPPSLLHFLSEAPRLSLPRRPIGVRSIPLQDHWLKLNVSPKKKHEVERLCGVIESACAGLTDAVLVDVGAGEGYLSSALSVLLKLPLVGIDCSESNVQGAMERTAKIVSGLEKRAQKGQRIEREGAEKRSKTAEDASIPSGSDAIATLVAGSVNPPPLVVHIKHFLSREITEKELLALVNTALNSVPETPRSLILLGLHVCGELVPILMSLYTTCPSVRLLAAVGCCYYKMGTKLSPDVFEVHGCPMSAEAKAHSLRLTVGALSLGCESVAGWCAMSAEEYDWMLRATFYRALLEPLLLRWIPMSHNDFHLRGIPRNKCNSFSSYVAEARKRLSVQLAALPSPVTLPLAEDAQQLDQLYANSELQMRQLAVFLALRTVLAGVLESYVLLDRLQALREKAPQVGDVRMFAVFEETQSPRNMILLARRDKPLQ